MKEDEVNTRISDAKAKGRAEGIALKARETALKAIDMGLTIEQAAKLSGLSVKEVNSLKTK